MNIHAASVILKRIDCLETIIKYEERKLYDTSIIENRDRFRKINARLRQLSSLKSLNITIYNFLKGNH